MATTTNLLSSLIQNWERNASMCDFNLVAVPVHKGLLHEGPGSSGHPFRRPSFIPLSLPPDIRDKWRDEGEMCVAERTRTLLLAIASRNGFLPDCPPAAPDSSVLSPHYADTSDHLSPSLHVHHTGTALVRPVLAGEPRPHPQPDGFSPLASVRGSHLCRGGGVHQLLHPHNATSTPLERSPEKSAGLSSITSHTTGSSGETLHLAVPGGGDPGSGGDPGAGGATEQSGFLWHKNCLLPKQKNVSPALLARYPEILEKFTADCRNDDGVLNTLCETLFPCRPEPEVV
jgi:hypothetical protein